LLRTRPKTYRAIVRLLAEPDAKIEHIAQQHRVSTHTVRAIREREAVAIADRKQRLVSIFGNVAELAAERMEELAGKASLRDAGTTEASPQTSCSPYSGKAVDFRRLILQSR
jgi:transposase-like protein